MEREQSDSCADQSDNHDLMLVDTMSNEGCPNDFLDRVVAKEMSDSKGGIKTKAMEPLSPEQEAEHLRHMEGRNHMGD